MTTHIERVKLEDPLSAAHTNQLVDAANANAEPGIAGGMWSSGVHGATAAILPDVSTATRYIELYDALAPGGTAQAYIRNWDSDTSAYVTDTDFDTFEVVDVLNRHRGRARSGTPASENDSGGTRGKHGSFGRAVYRSGRWEIEELEAHALLLVATVNEPDDSSDAGVGFATSDTTIDVDAVTIVQPTDQAIIMDDIELVYNVHDWEGDDNARLVAFWNDATEQWEAIMVNCPA